MRHSRPAFATMLAIVLLALATVALATLVTVSRSDHLRTQSDIEQAQLRQLVLAAVIDANAKAANWADAPAPRQWTLVLPSSSGAAKMEVFSVSPTQANIGITASIGKNRAMQVMHFSRVDSRWQLIEVAPGS